MKKIVFLTGTRADWGKIKSIVKAVDESDDFEAYVYVTGMHLLKKCGYTYKIIEKENIKNTYVEDKIKLTDKMDVNLANTIIYFSEYIRIIKPDFIVVHGDRVDALAAAIVGILNNIRVIHIEGGELTGTVDDSIRHAITKLSHIHFVANEESKIRLIQLGEKEKSIRIIGSPDIDIMLSDNLPNISDVKHKYKIDFDEYSIFMYHPVTTELDVIEKNVENVIKAIEKSNRKYICIYPNNDSGSNIILEKIQSINNKNIRIFQSFPFEDFLVLLRECNFIIGNSSAGIREACVYGIPCINIGTRQNNRFPKRILKNIVSVKEDTEEILKYINVIDKYKFKSYYFGDGHSTELFMNAMRDKKFTEQNIQKSFVDLDITQKCIQTYINEVCF